MLQRLLDNKNEDIPVIPTTGQREGGVTSENQNSDTDKIQHDSNEESRSLEKPVEKPIAKPVEKPVSIPEKPVIKSRVHVTSLQSNGRGVKRPRPTQSFSTGIKVDIPKTTPSNAKPVVPSKPLLIRTNRSIIKTETKVPPNRANECRGIEKGGVHTTLNKEQLLSKLNHQSQLNDYYGLLGVIPTATQEELARARREVTSKLHPDHFTGDPVQQAKYDLYNYLYINTHFVFLLII